MPRHGGPREDPPVPRLERGPTGRAPRQVDDRPPLPRRFRGRDAEHRGPRLRTKPFTATMAKSQALSPYDQLVKPGSQGDPPKSWVPGHMRVAEPALPPRARQGQAEGEKEKGHTGDTVARGPGLARQLLALDSAWTAARGKPVLRVTSLKRHNPLPTGQDRPAATLPHQNVT